MAFKYNNVINYILRPFERYMYPYMMCNNTHTHTHISGVRVCVV
jgi:hypothetical protein